MNPTLPAIPVGGRNALRVVSPGEVRVHEARVYEAKAKQKSEVEQTKQETLDALAGHIRMKFEAMRNHRNSASGWNERLLKAQRTFKGEYDPTKLAQINMFRGSDVYARITAVKCRGASSLLREVYLGPDKAWGVEATPEPTLPDDIAASVATLVEAEVAGLMEMGQPIDPMMIKDRTKTLIEAAYDASKKKAREEAKKAECKLDDLLVEGKFYRALAECLFDLTLFPFCVLKGPTVRMVPQVKWEKGKAITKTAPKMFWNRVSPFDIWWTPGVSEIEDAEICEKIRLTRADLNDLLGLPGYHEANIREILQTYPNGFTDWWDGTDSERAVHESRENPIWNQSGLIDCMEFHGNVQGSMLLEWGVKKDKVPDADRDYFVQAWLIGRYIIKVQIAPSPRKRHPYYVTSFEKVPGTPVGNGLPDILEDIQSVANAVLRALVNNLSIASGPQVMINDALFVNGTDGDELFPWKRWHFDLDPMNSAGSSSVKPIDFFQPSSNAQELMGLYEKLTQIADELSAIPRYITGSDRMGGAGRTASGLAMLMGNASKILQTVAANVDRDVMAPLLEGLYDMVMLTDESGILRGDETIRVRGVEVAVQRETNRQRQLEFLQITANPIDTQIMGVKGRATLLNEVSKTLGMTGVPIVPTPEDIDRMQQGALPMPGAPLTSGGNEPPAEGDPAAGGEGQQAPAPGSDNPGDQERKQSAGGNTMAPMAMPGQQQGGGPVAHFEQGGLVEAPKHIVEFKTAPQEMPELQIIRDPETNLIIGIKPRNN